LYYKQLFLDKYWDDGKTCYNINKRAESAFGIKRSEEFKKRVSDGHADVSGSKNPMWGKPCSEERKRKISERVRGSNQGSAILDENKIEEIKNYILNTDMTQKEIATIFGVGYTVIAHMLGGKSWKHCFSNEELLFIKNKAEKNKIKRLADLHTGETSKTAKLNNEKIEKIKFLILNTDMNLRQIAHKIQVNPTTISHILAGDAWKQNLTNEERDILKEKVKKNAKIHRRRSNV
jgi:predicted XRE-type DNA-binding protein